MERVGGRLPRLEAMEKYPETLWAEGSLALLERRAVSIVGTRRPNGYTKRVVTRLAAALAKRGVAVVSGGAMGIDALAHRGAGAADTISVMACGLNHRYPSVNRTLLDEIACKGLLLSQFDPDFKARPWSFVTRNELVVALGEVLVVAEADEGSGSMRSAEYALRMGREIFVFPHRLEESAGTLGLLKEGLATPIYDIDAFADRFGSEPSAAEDDLVAFCRTMPTYEETLARFGDRLYEAELEGLVAIREGRVIPL
ncbi:DNA-processing protein DprA [Hydrogenimonas sp.]